jgi:hypothetical protein
VAIIYPFAFASMGSMHWASLAGRMAAANHSSSCANRLVLRKGCCTLVVAAACKATGLAIAACNITVVSLLGIKLQAFEASKVIDRAAKTCFTVVEVGTYINAIQETEATSTSKATRTCLYWKLGTYQDLIQLAEVQIFTALTANE